MRCSNSYLDDGQCLDNAMLGVRALLDQWGTGLEDAVLVVSSGRRPRQCGGLRWLEARGLECVMRYWEMLLEVGALMVRYSG